MFQKLLKGTFQNKSSLIVELIVEKIQAGEYEVGSKLPPERIIAEHLGVGRPSVREAICALQVVGLVESRPGDGTYIVNTDLQRKSSAFLLIEESDNPFEALEARRTIEADTVRLAAKRRSEEELQSLKLALDRIVESIAKEDYDLLLMADRDFHQIIAKVAKNTVLEKIVLFLVEVMAKELWTRVKKQALVTNTQDHLAETIQSHQDIFDAVKAKDHRKAVPVMGRHFDEIEHLFK